MTLPSASCPLLGSAVGRRLVVLGLVVPPVPELILVFNANFVTHWANLNRGNLLSHANRTRAYTYDLEHSSRSG